MNQNYLKKYLDIKVFDDKTHLQYWNDDVLSYTYEYQIGLDKISKNLVSEMIMSNWVSGIIESLHQISLLDRVPTFIYLSTERYGNVFEKFLKHKNTYSQFYLEPTQNGIGVHVIIKKINYKNINSFIESSKIGENLEDKNNNKLKSYERYTKTISQFKI